MECLILRNQKGKGGELGRKTDQVNISHLNNAVRRNHQGWPLVLGLAEAPRAAHGPKLLRRHLPADARHSEGAPKAAADVGRLHLARNTPFHMRPSAQRGYVKTQRNKTYETGSYPNERREAGGKPAPHKPTQTEATPTVRIPRKNLEATLHADLNSVSSGKQNIDLLIPGARAAS